MIYGCKQGQIILMILRSQNKQVPAAKPQPVSIRDIMRQHDLSSQMENNNNNNILPPSLANPYYSSQSILNNVLQTHVPPSHIESQPSVQLPDPAQLMRVRETTPRRRKIFQEKPKNKPRLQFPQTNFNNSMKINQAPSSFGTTPQFTRLQASPSMRKDESIRAPQESFSTPAVNSSGTVYNTVPSMKKTTDNKNETVYEDMNSNFGVQPSGLSLRSRQSNKMSEGKVNNSLSKPQISSQLDPSLDRLSRNVSSDPPLPVYESKFYRNDKPKGEELRHQLFERPPSQNSPNTFQPPLASIPQPNGNQMFGAMIKDYKNFEARQTSSSQYPSFGYIPDNRPMRPTEPILTNQYFPPTERSFQKISAPPQYNYSAKSPFEQKRKEEIQLIPKRFQEIQNKVMQHDTELIQLNQKLAEAQLNDLESQKALLNQLIKKQQQLNIKQREINSNLEQITKMQMDSNLKKEQILKYELQIQQARRIEDLHRENQRLYHELIRKDRNTPSTADDNVNENYEGKKYLQKVFYRTPQVEDSNFHRFLSPFSINPEHY